MTDYTKFYGFSENPFDTSPDPKFFFPSESHSEALASLLYGINHKKGFILILGEAGIGKTTLIHHLINTLDAKVKTDSFSAKPNPFRTNAEGNAPQVEAAAGIGNQGLHDA